VAGVLLGRNDPKVTEGYGLLGIPYGFPWFPLAAGLFLVCAPSSQLVGRWLDNGFSRFIAKISFGIYLWHFLVIELLASVLPEGFSADVPDPWSNWLWSSALAVALSIAAGAASYYALERPVMSWARTLEKRRGSGQSVATSSGF
jgi:peptidoglycan/LPS O-acetylase OafA/YrhL